MEIDAFLTGNIKPPTINYEGKNPESWKYWYNERTGEFLEGEQNYDTFFMGGPIVPITKDFYFGLPGVSRIWCIRQRRKRCFFVG